MDFLTELRKSFACFLAMIRRDGHDDILSMPYAEYSLQCFVIYKNALYTEILQPESPLAQALSGLGITQPRDQLLVFLETFYLSNRLSSDHLN